MKNYNYWARLKKACEYRDVDVNAISKLVDVVRKRASGDREVANIFFHIITKIEPPCCQMSHCESYTAYGFCNCGFSRVPSKCKKHRDYLQRQYDRMEKVYLEGREFVRNAEKPIKFECPYEQHRKHIELKDKYALFKQGAEDEYANLPMRSMKTWKFNLEWGNPTDETIEEYLYFEHRSNAITAMAENLELSRFDIIRYDSYENKGKRIADVYFITRPVKGCGYWGNAKALKKPKLATDK